MKANLCYDIFIPCSAENFSRLRNGGRLWPCRKFVPNMRYFLVSINAPRAFYRFRFPNKIEIGVSDCIVDFRLLRTLG